MIRVLPPQQPEIVVVSTGASRFIPEIWSREFAKKFYPKDVIKISVKTYGATPRGS